MKSTAMVFASEYPATLAISRAMALAALNRSRHEDPASTRLPYKVLPPSEGVDKNWHVTDASDTCVAHCYGFGHDVASGEKLARRIAACLNVCEGIETVELEMVSAPAGCISGA